ncbi:MAG: TonB-dependent receptor, partial [Bryobacteraceae bacterium]
MRVFPVLAGLILILNVAANSQVTTATFYGVVQDSSGAAIPGAKVSLLNRDTGATRDQIGDPGGEFGFQFLPVGSYTLRIEAPGFQTYEAVGNELGAGQQIRKVYVLAVGQVSQKMEVASGAPLVNTVNAEQQHSISSREVSALPVGRRTLSDLMTLGSGIVNAGLGRFNFNGLGASAGNFTMDGIDASSNPQAPQAQFKEGQNYISIVSLEAVQEVQVTKGVFSAEYGRTMGGNVNVITKSGTNQWHGSAFELFNAEELNGRAQFLTVRPGTTFNQYGGSLGGPVRKDRIFVFGAYEGYQERSAVTRQGNVPTPFLREQMIQAVPAYKTVLDLFPLPTLPFAATAATGTYIAAGSQTASDNHFVLRPDIRLSDKALLSATYVRATPARLDPRVQELNPQKFDGTTNRLNLNFTYIGGPRWSSETRFGYNRDDRSRNDGFWEIKDPVKAESEPGGRRFPGINALGFSIGAELNIIGRAPHRSFDQKMSLTLGRHSLKFGGLIFWREIGSENIQNPTFTYQNMADLLANVPNAVNMTFGRNDADAKAKEAGLFLQDDFRVNSRLTLNLGVRYDFFSRFTSHAPGDSSRGPYIINLDGLTLPTFRYSGFRPFTNPYENDALNIGPRVGFAYSVDKESKTVVRGGFATTFQPLNGEIEKNMIQNAPDKPFRANISRVDAQRLGIRFPAFNEDVLKLIGTGVAPPNYQAMDPNVVAPYSMNFTFTVERALGGNFALETAFVGTRGVKLIGMRPYNTPDRVTGLRPNPALASDNYYDNSDSSHYYAWQTSLRKRYSRGLVSNIHYTWAKAIAYNRGDLGFGTSNIQDFFNIRANKGRPEGDVGHNFIADFVYQIPS